jgi:CheY-like chemotaxis protein
MIAVTDTGIGMSKEVLMKAFEPFFTTKDLGHGTGLGLSQVYGFIKQSNGHVNLYSEEGSGTTVKLYLPRHGGPPQVEPAAPAPRSSERPASKEKILVVEDDDDVRSFVCTALGELGYHVISARDSTSALATLESNGDVDLLFTDVGLPGAMNGRQLADEVGLRWPGLRVLFTTAYARNAIVHQGRLDPGVNFIAKPFTQTELAQKVQRILL